MALRDILDHQAGAIEFVMHTHGIRAQVDGGRLSPRLAHFHLALPPGVNPSRLVPMVPEIAHALGVISCRLAQHEGSVYLEAPRPDPVPVRLLPLVQRVADVVPPVTATLGMDTEGTPLLLRLNSPEVDPVMVVGEQASGKSSLLGGMALSMALHNSPDRLRLLLLDCTGEGTAFRGLENLPHLACPVAVGPVDSLVSLRWALRALARRAPGLEDDDELFFDDADAEDNIRDGHNPMQADEPALVIMIDGADALCSTANRRAATEALDALRLLLLAGSGHGIHIVMSAERPDGLMSINTSWGARITGRVESPETARIATGVKGSGAHGLLGAGDFLITLNAELIRFQAAAVSQQEVDKAVELILTCASSHSEPDREETARAQSREWVGAQPQPIRRSWNGE